MAAGGLYGCRIETPYGIPAIGIYQSDNCNLYCPVVLMLENGNPVGSYHFHSVGRVMAMANLMLSREMYETVRRWMYRNARPVDLARWQFLFEHGSAEVVLHALSFYQNRDGGFGHGLNPDFWNPHSSAGQLLSAIQILREIRFKQLDHPLIIRALGYLESDPIVFSRGYWYAEHPYNNEYPHAPWWSYGDEETLDKWGYHPTAAILGFIFYYTDADSAIHRRAQKMTKKAVAAYMEHQGPQDQEELSDYIHLYECMRARGMFDLFSFDEFESKLIFDVQNCISQDYASWKKDFACKPTDLFRSADNVFYFSNLEACSVECDFMITGRNEDGLWDIPWHWGDYPKEWAIAENWAKADLAIKNMLQLKIMDRIES